MQKFILVCAIAAGFLAAGSALAGSVSRGQFTTDVIDREPIDQVETLSTDRREIKYFTELTDLEGQSVTHQWVYGDTVMFERSFEVGGPRWRVWTSKSLQPGWTGIWSVHTLDGERNKILTQTFEYQ